MEIRVETVEYSKVFKKQLQKFPKKYQEKAIESVELLVQNSHHAKLRLHELKGRLVGVYSISAGGDLRLHFEFNHSG